MDKLELNKITSEDKRKCQTNWEDEEINDNFENILKREITNK